MPGPLHDIRAPDLTAMVTGPVATMILADQGADVIKVEPPAGDILRNLGVVRRGMSAFFLSCNRSKRSLSLDLNRPAGWAIVKKLIGTADVFVQNFRPGAIERMALDEVLVRGIRPRRSLAGIWSSRPRTDTSPRARCRTANGWACAAP
ncbi:MAG: CoA transferase [SAR324 cluster bacterium]|nr:CoA transferase [SAR324 cluster bacterium]